MKLTDESGRVVACYTYGTYGELLSGDTTLTRFLYNGRCGVTTDDNGLYYMRQRYYNPEIKRFVNQDMLAGSLANSQSLNRYSYVQGNPVSYTDPFGLAPESEMSVGSMIAHGVLGIVGMVPGWVGAVANLADAAVYAFVDHDYGMAAVSLVNAFSMGATKYLTGAGKVVTGAGKVVQVGSQATKVSKGARYAYVISELISNGATFVTAANNTMDIGFHMYEKYEIQGRSYDENTIYEGAALLMNIFTMGMSGNGMIHHGKALGEMVRADIIGRKLKNELTRWAQGEVDRLTAISKTQRDKFKAASIAYDSSTNKYYFGKNNGINSSGSEKNPILFGDSNIEGILPTKSFNKYKIGNCAEVDAVNNALNDGAQLQNLYISTIDTTVHKFGELKRACQNCTYTFQGRIIINYAG